MLNKIRNIVNNLEFNENKIYLLDHIDESNGFLLNGNSVWFISKNIFDVKDKNIQTQYLTLRTNLFITGIAETSHFNPDYYNVIMLKDYSESELLDIFVSLCRIFVEKKNELTFEQYFEILIDLFQIEAKEKTLNQLGLFGELVFIKFIYDNEGIDLSPFWHIKNMYDKHDFNLPSLSLEVKTTLKSELIFQIKHFQLFNEQDIIVVLVRVYESGNGVSLEELVSFFLNNKPFNQNLKFVFSLNVILSKVKTLAMSKNKYILSHLNFYSNKDLATINHVPTHITSLTYLFDFNGQKELNYKELINKITIR